MSLIEQELNEEIDRRRRRSATAETKAGQKKPKISLHCQKSKRDERNKANTPVQDLKTQTKIGVGKIQI
jgi:hypothetical protein